MEIYGNNFKIHHIIWFVETLRKIISIEKVQTWPKTTFDNRIVGFIYRTWKNVRFYHRKITRKFIVSINRTFFGLYQTLVLPKTEGYWRPCETQSSEFYRTFLPKFDQPTYKTMLYFGVNYSLNTCKQVLMNLY